MIISWRLCQIVDMLRVYLSKKSERNAITRYAFLSLVYERNCCS